MSKGGVIPLCDLWEERREEQREGLTMNVEDMHCSITIDMEILNSDQKRAYDIVDWHLKDTIAGKKPPQLLMMIPGEGGVGKSKLIQTMTQNFKANDVEEWWVKDATCIRRNSCEGRKTICSNSKKTPRILVYQTIFGYQ